MDYIVLVDALLPQFRFSLCSRIIKLKQWISNTEKVNIPLLRLIPRFYATFFKLVKMFKFVYVCICWDKSTNSLCDTENWNLRAAPVVFEEDIGYQRILYPTGRSPKSSWWATSAFALSVPDPCWTRKRHDSPRATWSAAMRSHSSTQHICQSSAAHFTACWVFVTSSQVMRRNLFSLVTSAHPV